MILLETEQKNAVLDRMVELLNHRKEEIISQNKKDLDAFQREDQALYDRLVVNEAKVEDMIRSVREVRAQEDPVSRIIDERILDSGLRIINKTEPFGTIMIIYESRPDVTIEAAVLAFKANNKILLKGGREAYHSNKILVDCWHQALAENALDEDWIQFLEMDRSATQDFLKNPTQPVDLIVPRGGEKLIAFVKQYARCAVLVSGRGNNFMYVSKHADWDKTKNVILNAKTQKISACNALDKVLLDASAPDKEEKWHELERLMSHHDIAVIVSQSVKNYLPNCDQASQGVLDEEFLDRKIYFGEADHLAEAIRTINQHSGHHSSIIMTENSGEAVQFMEQIDSAAVYQNASSRFTDGGAMGVGAELAISTDKLHHRGPLGLKQLVSNKYYVFGDGHVRA